MTERPKPLILLTRPKRQNEEFANDFLRHLTAKGCEIPAIVKAPLRAIVAEEGVLEHYQQLSHEVDNLVITSASVFEVLPPEVLQLPAFVVGKESAKRLGNRVVCVADNASELSEEIKKLANGQKLLWLRAKPFAFDFQLALTGVLELAILDVYTTKSIELDPEIFRKCQAKDVIVPLFSKHHVNAFISQFQTTAFLSHIAGFRFAAISEGVALELQRACGLNAEIAPRSDRSGMIEILKKMSVGG